MASKVKKESLTSAKLVAHKQVLVKKLAKAALKGNHLDVQKHLLCIEGANKAAWYLDNPGK